MCLNQKCNYIILIQNFYSCFSQLKTIKFNFENKFFIFKYKLKDIYYIEALYSNLLNNNINTKLFLDYLIEIINKMFNI